MTKSEELQKLQDLLKNPENHPNADSDAMYIVARLLNEEQQEQVLKQLADCTITVEPTMIHLDNGGRKSALKVKINGSDTQFKLINMDGSRLNLIYGTNSTILYTIKDITELGKAEKIIHALTRNSTLS